MIIYLFIFLCSLGVAFFLLEEVSFFGFIQKNYISILFSVIIYCIPKLFFPSQISFFLDIGFCITIITDIIEYSVFSIIPMLLIFYSFISHLLQGNYYFIFISTLNSIIIYGIFLLLIFFIKKLFNKEGLGVGDLYFYFIFVWYFDLCFLGISFFLASLLGLFFILLHKLIFFKKPFKQIIPFIPCLYLSILILQIDIIYEKVVCFIFI